MQRLRETITALDDADRLGPSGAALYEELAPVYDFVVARYNDYNSIDGFVAEHAPPATDTVAVGACGSGHLLARLDDRFDRVVGVDRSKAMLELAGDRTDTHRLLADLETFVAPGRFDLYTLVGGSIAHLPVGGRGGTDAVRSVLENAAESLAPGGVFVCDFMEAGALEGGDVLEDTFESDRYRVRRTVITTGVPDAADELGNGARFTYAYEITHRETDETVRASTAVPVREFRTGALFGTALAAGFDDVALATPPTNGRAIVARVSK